VKIDPLHIAAFLTGLILGYALKTETVGLVIIAAAVLGIAVIVAGLLVIRMIAKTVAEAVGGRGRR